MNKENILKAFSDFLDDYKPEPELELEKTNFRIPSIGWKKVSEDFLVNPTNDVWEIREGKYTGEQLFTHDSAIRETKKVGKIIPDKDELEMLLKRDDCFKSMPLVGCRINTDGTLYNQGMYGYYWASTISYTDASNLTFDSSAVFPANIFNRDNGFSVRCLKS
jgi:hypothetical protein